MTILKLLLLLSILLEIGQCQYPQNAQTNANNQPIGANLRPNPYTGYQPAGGRDANLAQPSNARPQYGDPTRPQNFPQPQQQPQPQYSFGQYHQPQSPSTAQNPANNFGANHENNPVNQLRQSSANLVSSLSSKLEQQIRPQSQQQQQQQQQRLQQNEQQNGRLNTSLLSRYHQQQQQYGGEGGGGGGVGVNVQIQLRSYANPERQIGHGKLCTCPQGNLKCIETSPTRNGYTCLFSFTVIVASEDSTVHKKVTPFLLLNGNGQISPEYLPNFQQSIDFQLENTPSSINVFVNNLGPVIDQAGTVEDWNTVTEVDTFVKPLNSASGSNGGYGSSGGSSGGYGGSYQQPQQTNLVGTQLGTQLSLTYTVSCRGRLIGPGCDLSCNKSTVNSGSAICVNARTGYFSLCRWTNSNSQVSECKNCPWGIEENSYCRDENGGVLEANHAGVVSEGYQTASIILAILCGLLVFCLLATCVYACAKVPRKSRTSATSSRTPPGYNNGNFQPPNPPPKSATTYLTHAGEAENNAPLNSAPNGAALPHAPPRSGHAGQHFLPPLLNGKAKSSMRSPLLFSLPPPAHLGGGHSSLNDTLNSSFTGSQAPNGPPSVSADV